MNIKTKQEGNVPIVLAIIVAIAIICALGFVVWQNFLKPASMPSITANESKETATDLPLVVPLEIASDETLGSGFAVSYPKGWTNVHSGASQPESTTSVQTDQNTITSPSGNIQVILKVQTNIQTSAPCSNSGIKLKHLEVDTTPDYVDGRFAAYVVYFPNISLYQYHAGLQKNTEAIRGVTLTSNTTCNFFYSEFIQRPSSLLNVPITSTLLSIKFVDLYNGDNLKLGIDETQVAEKLSGSEYEQAKTIVQSVYIHD